VFFEKIKLNGVECIKINAIGTILNVDNFQNLIYIFY